MTPTHTTLVSWTLLVLCLALFVAYLKARKSVNDLRTRLAAAHIRRESDERELIQRSELDRIKDEFVSNVSHELRTPLTSVRGALGLLSSGVLGTVDSQAQNLLRIALTNTERLIRLINDILDLQRMDSGLSVLQVRRCSLPELIHQAIETMGSMADAATVKLTVAPAAKAILPSIFFDGDADRILQVLTNLLSNAVKFSPPDAVVTIEVETPPDTLIFRIADQGRGIPEEQLETIFERFTQVEHSDARQRGGTGLGLAICRSIVQQHGGIIWAQRNPVKGVSVCVRLPRAQRTNDVPVQDLPALARPAPCSPAENALLICDDDLNHRAATALQLRTHGHTVLEASSSGEAIEIAQSQPGKTPLQAILLDLQMSDMQGWELLKTLTKNALTSTTPIVVLSAQSPMGTVERSRVPSLDDDLFAELGRAIDSGLGSSHVLLVEDDLDLADVVIRGFTKTAVKVHHATTLERAMTYCSERQPTLMVLDLTLPGGDGFAIIEWLRARPDFRSMPLIVYSGREVSPEERVKLRLGPTRFLTQARVAAQDVEQLVLSLIYNGNPTEEKRSSSPASAPRQVRI